MKPMKGIYIQDYSVVLYLNQLCFNYYPIFWYDYPISKRHLDASKRHKYVHYFKTHVCSRRFLNDFIIDNDKGVCLGAILEMKIKGFL